MRVLLVEDNLETSQVLIKMLRHGGHEVTHTTQGLEGMRLARQENFDMILLDFNLPDLDGSQVGLTLRNSLKNTPIVAITSDHSRLTRKKAEIFGFDAFVPKPTETQELLAVVQTTTHKTPTSTGQFKAVSTDKS